MGGLLGTAINDVLSEDNENSNKGKAICRTCGSSVDNHQPSVFDPMGNGNPGHRMDSPGLSSYHEDYYLRLEEKEPAKHPSYYGTFDEQHYINELVMALDGEITYGDLWDSNPENKEAFDAAREILEEYKYGVLNGIIGSGV